MTNAEYLSQIANLQAGEHMIQTPDQRGDGYDIACAVHDDSLEPQIREIVTAKRGSVSRLYASGYFCAWVIRIPADNETVVLTQHSGSWGPWYHCARYKRTASGAWKYVESWGHYSHAAAKALGLPFGRPRQGQK